MEIRKPMFSIIVPVYNVQKYVGECVDSVIGQSFKNYELILIDDGSTDNSFKICQEYQRKYPDKVKCIHKRNEGQLMTRLLGIEKSVGRYIVSLDADDCLRSDALELINMVIEQKDSDLIMFNASRNSDFSIKWLKCKFQQYKVLNLNELYDVICDSTDLNNMALKVFRREFCPAKEYFNKFSGVNYGEDLIQSLYVIDHCEHPVYIDEALYFYRENDESVSYRLKDTYFYSIEKVGMLLREYANKWDQNGDIYTTKVIQRNLKSCVRTVKEVITWCAKKEDRNKFYNDIHNSAFFKSSVTKGNVKALSLIDQILIYCCKNKFYFVYEVLRTFVSLKRMVFRG